MLPRVTFVAVAALLAFLCLDSRASAATLPGVNPAGPAAAVSQSTSAHGEPAHQAPKPNKGNPASQPAAKPESHPASQPAAKPAKPSSTHGAAVPTKAASSAREPKAAADTPPQAKGAKDTPKPGNAVADAVAIAERLNTVMEEHAGRQGAASTRTARPGATEASHDSGADAHAASAEGRRPAGAASRGQGPRAGSARPNPTGIRLQWDPRLLRPDVALSWDDHWLANGGPRDFGIRLVW